MSSPRSRLAVQRPLVSTGALLGLAGGAALLLGALLPLAREREHAAQSGEPDLLSLVYLRLGLGDHPADEELRLTLAEKNLDAGLFDAARLVLEPLLSGESQAASRARELLVEVEFQAWAAVAPAHAAARGVALERYNRTLARVDLSHAPASRVEHFADLSEQTGQPLVTARLLTQLAEREPVAEDVVARADATLVAAGRPMDAAELHARLAERLTMPRAAEHAALALERAQAANEPARALGLFERLSAHFPRDPRLLEQGLRIGAARGDGYLLGLAERLLASRPGDADLHRRIATLADNTGRTGRAIEQYLWLARHGGGLRDRERALERARATSDLRLMLALTQGEPESKRDLLDRIALYEALGEAEHALATLDAGLQAAFGEDESLWQLELELRRRAGDVDGALATLRVLQTRFPGGRDLSYVHADLLLSQGKLAEALDALSGAPGKADAVRVRQVSVLAWELGDSARARQAYQALVATVEASEADYQRLWLLEHEAEDYGASLETAMEAWQHFHTPDLLGMAIYSATAWKRQDLVQELLARAESAGSYFSGNPAYWQLRVHLQLEDAERFRQRAEHVAARQALDTSARFLERAGALAPQPSGGYEALWQRQRAQVLSLALASNDRETLARIYPTEAPTLAPRQRVNILYRLGRTEAATELAAHASRRVDLSVEDRGALAEDAQSLGSKMPRYLAGRAGVLQMPGLLQLDVGARAEYAWEGQGVSASVELAELLRDRGAPFEVEAPFELSIAVGGRLGAGSLSLGVIMRNAGSPRPFVRFEQALLGLGDDQLSLAARVNERSFDTASLRVLGVEDELAVSGSMSLPGRLFVTGRTAAKLYSTRDRDYLGAGFTLEGAAGRRIPAGDLGTAAVRIAALLAPRFPGDRASQGAGLAASSTYTGGALLPDSTTFFGVGASLMRGELGVPRLDAGRFSFLLDGATGYLPLQGSLGWWASAGLGFPVWGGDLISISARAGNVLGAVPAFAVFGMSADYAVSQW